MLVSGMQELEQNSWVKITVNINNYLRTSAVNHFSFSNMRELKKHNVKQTSKMSLKGHQKSLESSTVMLFFLSGQITSSSSFFFSKSPACQFMTKENCLRKKGFPISPYKQAKKIHIYKYKAVTGPGGEIMLKN